MNELSLFSGSGGGILASQLLGHEIIGAVENNEYCCKVLEQRQRDGILKPFPIYQIDIRDFIRLGYAELYQGRCDIVSGGFPCQDISAAGKGAGIDGEKSGMWKYMADAIRIIRPRFAFMENSPMLTSRGLGRVLGDLAAMGFDARWGVLGGNLLGAFHRRERIWIVAVATGDGLEGRDEAFKTQHRQAAGRSIPPLDLYPPWSEAPHPRAFGSGDVVAHRVDRLRAIGNGQVPIVAATAWRILSGIPSPRPAAPRAGEGRGK